MLEAIALRDSRPSFYMCVIEYVVASMPEFTVNEASNKTCGR